MLKRSPRKSYAVFGLAAYMASVLEAGLAIHLTMLALSGRIHDIKTETEWQALHDAEMVKAHRLSLGAAIIRLRQTMPLDEELDVVLTAVLATRNYLVHHFFREQIGSFYSMQGSAQLHEKLVSYVELFSDGDRRLHAATAALRQRMGLTDESSPERLKNTRMS